MPTSFFASLSTGSLRIRLSSMMPRACAGLRRTERLDRRQGLARRILAALGSDGRPLSAIAPVRPSMSLRKVCKMLGDLLDLLAQRMYGSAFRRLWRPSLSLLSLLPSPPDWRMFMLSPSRRLRRVDRKSKVPGGMLMFRAASGTDRIRHAWPGCDALRRRPARAPLSRPSRSQRPRAPIIGRRLAWSGSGSCWPGACTLGWGIAAPSSSSSPPFLFAAGSRRPWSRASGHRAQPHAWAPACGQRQVSPTRRCSRPSSSPWSAAASPGSASSFASRAFATANTRARLAGARSASPLDPRCRSRRDGRHRREGYHSILQRRRGALVRLQGIRRSSARTCQHADALALSRGA